MIRKFKFSLFQLIDHSDNTFFAKYSGSIPEATLKKHLFRVMKINNPIGRYLCVTYLIYYQHALQKFVTDKFFNEYY